MHQSRHRHVRKSEPSSKDPITLVGSNQINNFPQLSQFFPSFLSKETSRSCFERLPKTWNHSLMPPFWDFHNRVRQSSCFFLRRHCPKLSKCSYPKITILVYSNQTISDWLKDLFMRSFHKSLPDFMKGSSQC